MRFIFTSSYSGTNNTGLNSLEGLEVMQLFPVEGGSEAFVGIGDWYGQGATPDERLDILDRTIRLRDFGPLANNAYKNQNANINRVLVADQNDGTVYWRPMSDFSGLTDCDWMEDGNGWFSCDVNDNYAIGSTAAVGGAKFVVRSNAAGPRIMRLFDVAGHVEFDVDQYGNVSIDADGFDSNSSVGIGASAAPGTKLLVQGSAAQANLLKLVDQSNHVEFEVDDLGNVSIDADIGGDHNSTVGIGTAAVAGTKLFVSGSASQTRLLALEDAGGGIEFEVDDDGNVSIDSDSDHTGTVGIGTAASTASKLSLVHKDGGVSSGADQALSKRSNSRLVSTLGLV